MSERGTVEQEPSRLPGIWTFTRDVLTFSGGWALVFMEVQRTELREAVLVFAATVIGVPTAFAVVAGRRSGTAEPSTRSPEVAPSPSASSPS